MLLLLRTKLHYYKSEKKGTIQIFWPGTPSLVMRIHFRITTSKLSLLRIRVNVVSKRRINYKAIHPFSGVMNINNF